MAAAIAAALLLVAAVALYVVRRIRVPAFRGAISPILSPPMRTPRRPHSPSRLLVIVPLGAGAATSLFAGTREEPRYVGLANYVAILTARGGGLLSQRVVLPHAARDAFCG